MGSDIGAKGVGHLGLVDLTFWCCWARCPKIVLLALGQHLAMLEYVRPSKVSQLPALMASNHICLTGKPRHKCADAGEVERLQVVGKVGCLGCHGHGLGCLPQELNLDVLPGGASSLEAFAGVQQAC